MTTPTTLSQPSLITAPAPGIIGQVRRLLLQPYLFFRQFPAQNQQWLFAALIILSLTAFIAVQLAVPATGAVTGAPIPPEGMPFEGEIPPDLGIPGDGGMPITPNTPVTADAWTTAFSAVGTLIVQWGVIAILLCEVALFNRRLPQIGINLQLAVWSSVPLALLAIVQIIFLSNGNTITNPGFTGFLAQHEGYLALSLPLQSLVYALASQFNLFWLWQLILLYIGARVVLRGKRSIVLMVVGLWVLLLTLSNGYQHYQQTEAAAPIDTPIEMPMPVEEMPLDGLEMTPETDTMPEADFLPENGDPMPEPTPEVAQP